jgi:hypothetical protein
MGPGGIAGLTFEPDGMFGRTDEAASLAALAAKLNLQSEN